MATPITWRNVSVDTSSTPYLAYEKSAEMLNNAFSQFKNVGDIYDKRYAEAKDLVKTDNTRKTLSAIQGIDTMPKFQEAVKSGDFNYEKLNKVFGEDIDYDAVDAVWRGKEKEVMDLTNARNAYTQQQNKLADDPLINAFRAKVSQTDFSNPDQIKSVQDLYKTLQEQFRDSGSLATAAELIDTATQADIAASREAGDYGRRLAAHNAQLALAQRMAEVGAEQSTVPDKRFKVVSDLYNQVPSVMKRFTELDASGRIIPKTKDSMTNADLHDSYLTTLDMDFKNRLERNRLTPTELSMFNDGYTEFKNTVFDKAAEIAQRINTSVDEQVPYASPEQLNARLTQGLSLTPENVVASQQWTKALNDAAAERKIYVDPIKKEEAEKQISFIEANAQRELDILEQQKTEVLNTYPDPQNMVSKKYIEDNQAKVETVKADIMKENNFQWFGTTPATAIEITSPIIDEGFQYKLSDGKLITIPFPASVIKDAYNAYKEGKTGEWGPDDTSYFGSWSKETSKIEFRKKLNELMATYLNNQVAERNTYLADIEQQRQATHAAAALQKTQTENFYGRPGKK